MGRQTGTHTQYLLFASLAHTKEPGMSSFCVVEDLQTAHLGLSVYTSCLLN